MKTKPNAKLLAQISIIERLLKAKGKRPVQRLWTIEDVHTFSEIPISTLKFYVKQGRIPSVKLGRHRRFIPREIRQWAKEKAMA